MASSRNNSLEFSSVGSIILDGTSGEATAGEGTYGAIQFLKDSEITSISGDRVTNITLLQTTLGAGTVLYGRFTNVTVASGGLIAVHKV